MMTNWIRRIAAVAALSVLAACSATGEVKPGVYAPNSTYEVTVGKTWTAYPPSRINRSRVLTIDGMLLNQMTFIASIRDGENILGVRRNDKNRLVPQFRSDMGGFEIAELVTDSLTVSGMIDVESSNLRPEPFGSLDGIRFDFNGAMSGGLRYGGTAKAAVDDGTLHLIVYYAPSEYYYGLHDDEVQAVMNSVKMK